MARCASTEIDPDRTGSHDSRQIWVDFVTTKQTTVRLPVELAEEAEVVARIQGKSLNEFIIGALSVEIDRVRKDKKFMDALKYVIEHDREILDRLAQ